MIPYVYFVILILLFRYFKKPFCIYLTLVLFCVLRYNTGWDYMSYVEEIEYWGTAGSNMQRYSVLWQWLFEYSQRINNPHFAIAITGFSTITIIYFVVNKLCQKKWLICDVLTIYAIWPFFFLGTFSTIRQSLAIAIGLLILYYSLRKKIKYIIVALIINYFVHPSSVVCVCYLAFLLPQIKLKLWHLITVIILAIITLYSIGLIIQNSLLSVYVHYLSANDSYGSKLSILLVIILIPMIFLRNKHKVDQGLMDFCIISLVLTIITFLILKISVITRVTDYFTILLIFIVPYFKYIFKNKKIGNALVFIAFIGVFFYYLISTKGAANQGLAMSPFVPYQFIF